MASKKFAEYDFKSGQGAYNNSTDTFSWLLVADTFASINANMANPVIGSFTPATVGGNYAGKTALTGTVWSRDEAVSSLTYDTITFAADPANPTDAVCIVMINDTSATDDALRVTELVDGDGAPVDLTQGLTINVNAAGAVTVTTNA